MEVDTSSSDEDQDDDEPPQNNKGYTIPYYFEDSEYTIRTTVGPMSKRKKNKFESSKFDAMRKKVLIKGSGGALKWVDWSEHVPPPAFAIEEDISRVVETSGQQRNIGYVYWSSCLDRYLWEYMLDAQKLEAFSSVNTRKKVFESWRIKTCKLIRKMEYVYTNDGNPLTSRGEKCNDSELTALGYDVDLIKWRLREGYVSSDEEWDDKIRKYSKKSTKKYSKKYSKKDSKKYSKKYRQKHSKK